MSFELKIKEHDKLFEEYRIMCGEEYCKIVYHPEQRVKSKYNFYLIFVAIVVFITSCSMTYVNGY